MKSKVCESLWEEKNKLPKTIAKGQQMGSRLSLLMIGIVAFAVTAVAQPSQRMQMTPEQRLQRLQDSLALSDSQSVQILAIFKENDVKRAELFEMNAGDRDAMREAMRILARETDAKIEAILTTEQTEKYQVLRKQWQERRGEMRRRGE